MTYKWSLAQKGATLGRFDIIIDCISEIRRLNPDSRVTREVLTPTLEEVTVVSNDFVTYYTLLWEVV